MKKSKEYKISIALFVVALVFDFISIVTGLIPDFDYSIDKTCMYLGNLCLILGFLFLKKSKDNNDDK